MLESIFDDNINTNEDIEMLDISDPTPEVEMPTVIETPKIEPIENIIEEVKPEIPAAKVKTKDNIFLIQIILIAAWAILTSIVYFFGYPLFEPFIGV